MIEAQKQNRSNLSGLQFGKLKIISFCESRGGRRHWNCQCECGGTRIVKTSDLRNGHVKSCGCLVVVCKPTHGLSRSPEYTIWKSMRARCLNKKHKSFNRYGGRGILVCERWLHSFQNFITDMGTRPLTGHSIERIDSNGNYEPSNCKWVAWGVQANNRSNNVTIEAFGERHTISEWAKIKNLRRDTIGARLKRGWSKEAAITTP